MIKLKHKIVLQKIKVLD